MLKLKGFTLIELLAALAIMSILIAIAYPSYREHIVRSRRLDGQTALLDLASRIERFYSENNTYKGATLGTHTETDIRTSTLSSGGWYSLAISEQTDATYSLKATPLHAQAATDLQCQAFTLNSVGVKGVTTGPSGVPILSADQCW